MKIDFIYGYGIPSFNDLINLFFNDLKQVYTKSELNINNYSDTSSKEYMMLMIFDYIKEVCNKKYNIDLFYMPYKIDNSTPDYVVGTYSYIDLYSEICLDNPCHKYPNILRTKFFINPMDIKLYIICEDLI